MSKQRPIDTNLIVRYPVQDHDKHAGATGRLFDACDRGDLVIMVFWQSVCLCSMNCCLCVAQGL